MTDKPETVADVLAEMRSQNLLSTYDWADRIERARERETKARGSAPEVTDSILRIPAGDKLDPIVVYFDEESPGRGRMTIACWGNAWTAWWGGMGGRTVRQFVAGCDAGYLSGAMLELRRASAADRIYAQRIATRVIAALQEPRHEH